MISSIHHGHLPKQWQFLIPAAKELGAGAVGVASATPVPNLLFKRYCDWVNSPMGASLEYLKSHLVERQYPDHSNIQNGAQVVVSVAFAYGEGTVQDGVWPFIAAHARARDYHKTIKNKLSVMAQQIQQQFPNADLRIFVDSAPVMERCWAALAGIGAIGRNGMLIVPGIGPKVLLGEIICACVPGAEVEGESEIEFGAFQMCGECNRCLHACPTNALNGDGTLNANVCLSRLTIEKQDTTDTSMYISKGDTIFGCDRCLDVCPQNKQAQSVLEPPPVKHIADSLEELTTLSPEQCQQRLRGTALYRTGAEVIIKNARIILEKETDKTDKQIETT